ncbi:MAG: transmembrane sensor [Paraglaciecola sp.]|jgi:transmembrane sensor
MKKYLPYNVQDFAEDDAFIRWVKKARGADEKKWAQWLSEHPEKQATVQQAKILLKTLQFKEADATQEAENRVWSKISVQTRPQFAPKKTAIIRYLLPLAAAAAVLFLVWFNFGQSAQFDTMISNQIAQQSTEQLPDGSFIHINTASILQYNKADWSKSRLVYLEGEAFFEVEKGDRFTVETKNGTVEVLGTSFNVFTRDNVLEVICKTGKVAVKGANKTTVLTPQQGVTIINKQHISADEASISLNRGEWRKGTYTYKSQALITVFADMERQFGTKIKTDTVINTMLFSGSFTANKLEDALYEVCWPLKLKYGISENQVVVSK